MVVMDVAQRGNMMKPSEVFAMREWLGEALYDRFGDTVNLHMDSSKVAEWLIGAGWVTGCPDE